MGTKAQANHKLKIITDLLLECWDRAEILRYAANEGWGITDSAVDKIISKANKYIKQKTMDEIDDILAERIKQYKHLYKKSINKDKHVARQCLGDLNKIQGLEKLSIQHTGKIDLTFEGIVNYISDAE